MDDMNDSLQDFFHFFRREAPAALLAGFEALGAAPPPQILVEDVNQMLETSISCIISNWNNARSGASGLEAVPQHTGLPVTFPPVTNSMVDGISIHSRSQQVLHPTTNTAHAMTRNASTGDGSFVSSSPSSEISPVPQLFITADETHVDDPPYPLDEEETADSIPIDWNWDQILAELE